VPGLIDLLLEGTRIEDLTQAEQAQVGRGPEALAMPEAWVSTKAGAGNTSPQVLEAWQAKPQNTGVQLACVDGGGSSAARPSRVAEPHGPSHRHRLLTDL
jgi:hypothetical protein